jgi:predicted AAA+ superfamily ATPase
MIARRLGSLLAARLRDYPAAALVGPRQCGKTTLAKSLRGTYFDLEKEPDRLRLDVEWDKVAAGRSLVILDEAQEMPAIFPRLRAAIDEDRKRKGRFLLLGSVSPALMKQVGESLAGRLALCELAPLAADELPPARWDDLWHFGGYPDGGVINAARFPEWQRFYLDLLAQRDLPHWGLPARAATTQRLFRMLAAVHGQTWNASQIGKSLGLSYHTVNQYVDFLEQAFLIRRLPAYSANLRKRLVKAPKLYWRDPGLLHALLDL